MAEPQERRAANPPDREEVSGAESLYTALAGKVQALTHGACTCRQIGMSCATCRRWTLRMRLAGLIASCGR